MKTKKKLNWSSDQSPSLALLGSLRPSQSLSLSNSPSMLTLFPLGLLRNKSSPHPMKRFQSANLLRTTSLSMDLPNSPSRVKTATLFSLSTSTSALVAQRELLSTKVTLLRNSPMNSLRDMVSS